LLPGRLAPLAMIANASPATRAVPTASVNRRPGRNQLSNLLRIRSPLRGSLSPWLTAKKNLTRSRKTDGPEHAFRRPSLPAGWLVKGNSPQLPDLRYHASDRHLCPSGMPSCRSHTRRGAASGVARRGSPAERCRLVQQT
jgi:hypothetical protein